MGGWNKNDPAWLNKRKAHWKTIKPSINYLQQWKRDEISCLQNYFLYGDTGDKKRPITRIDYSALLEMWLNADTSLENFEKIKARYLQTQGGRTNFSMSGQLFYSNARNASTDNPNKGGSFFDGLEDKLFDIFIRENNKFNRYMYKHIDDEAFQKEALLEYGIYATFIGVLDPKKFHPFNISRYEVPLWRSIIPYGYRERPRLKELVDLVYKVLEKPESFHEYQVQLAKELEEVFNDQSLPEEFLSRVKKLKENELRQGLCILEFKPQKNCRRFCDYFEHSARPKVVSDVPEEESSLVELIRYTELTAFTKFKKGTASLIIDFIDPLECIEKINEIAQFFKVQKFYSIVNESNQVDRYEIYQTTECKTELLFKLDADQDDDISQILFDRISDLKVPELLEKGFVQLRERRTHVMKHEEIDGAESID